jgi:hypothetical protein
MSNIKLSEKNNPQWKGDDAGYTAIHNWVRRKLGQPKYCEHCKRTDKKMYHWANISGKCKRDVLDWKRLCVSCHRKYDAKECIIVCVICGNIIKTVSKKRKYCSNKCSWKYWNKKTYWNKKLWKSK